MSHTMIKIAELKADIDALQASISKGGTADPLLQGFKVERSGGVSKLVTFDGTSCTTLEDRNWGEGLPEGGIVLPPTFAKLLKVLNKVDEVEIKQLKKGQIQVKQKDSKWKFPMSLDTTAFYPIGDNLLNGSTPSMCISVDASLLREAMLNVYPSLGAEHSAYCSAQIVFNLRDKELTALSTDMRRSTIWKTINVQYKQTESAKDEYKLLLPGGKLLPIAKFLQSNTGLIQVFFNDSVAVFYSESQKASLSVRLLSDNNYPPLLTLFKMPFVAGYAIQSKEVIEGLKRARILLPENKLTGKNTLVFTFEKMKETASFSHESELFTENISCKSIDEIDTPETFTSALNLDYLYGALSLVSGGAGTTCELKLNPDLASLSASTLGGVVTHFISTVKPPKK